MRRTFESLSTWIFRLAAISVLSFVVHAIVREYRCPAKVDLQDAKFLERLEDSLKRERACKAAMSARQKKYESTHGPFKGKSRY